MFNKYYLDTCIWKDYFENRSDKFKPLGEWAFQFLKKALSEEGIIIYSKVVENELLKDYNEKEIKNILKIV